MTSCSFLAIFNLLTTYLVSNFGGYLGPNLILNVINGHSHTQGHQNVHLRTGPYHSLADQLNPFPIRRQIMFITLKSPHQNFKPSSLILDIQGIPAQYGSLGLQKQYYLETLCILYLIIENVGPVYVPSGQTSGKLRLVCTRQPNVVPNSTLS